MSFMPNIGSLVRLVDGRVGVVTKITPLGEDDRIWTGVAEERISFGSIREVLHEPETERPATRVAQ